MLRIDTERRPIEGWHQSNSGTCYYVTHVGKSTQIECFEKGDVTAETQARLAYLSQEKAKTALTPMPSLLRPSTPPRSPPMQRS